MDRILLQGIQFRGHHGVSPEERAVGGHFSVDLELVADLRRAGRSDRIADTVDYGEVFQTVQRIGGGERFHLLETLAERIAASLLSRPTIESVRVRVKKHHPPFDGIADYAAVEIERTSGVVMPPVRGEIGDGDEFETDEIDTETRQDGSPQE